MPTYTSSTKMQIRGVALRELRIPLNFQFRQSNNGGATRSLSVLLELQLQNGIIGYGEACPRTYVTGESVTDVRTDLNRIRPQLLQQPITSLLALQRKLREWTGQGIGPSTRCAFELAWLDAWSKTEGISLPQLVGFYPSGTLHYSLVVPLVKPATLRRLLEKISHFQPPALKLKVDADLSRNLRNIELLQAHFGSDIPIRVDVNGGWTLEQALKLIPKLMAVGVFSFEQAVAADNIAGLKMLTETFGHEARIMADESLLNLEQAAYFLENGVCNHFNLKISKLGGIFSTLQVYRLAEQHGIPCQLGAHFGETSILAAAGAVMAGMAEGELTACEGAMGAFLLSSDIVERSIQFDLQGRLALDQLWQHPGLAGRLAE